MLLSIISTSNHKMINRKQLELMAPVGSYESLQAAIMSGADAVYFGVEGLNMRAGSAANFTIDDLRNIAGICNEAGIKSYLTVNTIIYNPEMELMHRIVDAARDAGISAIIASDMAVIGYARSIGVEVHISTQLNLSNTEAVKFYSAFADVVVLARELSMDQVGVIARDIDNLNITGPKGEKVRIEMFCHGALCMAVSGKCYLSLHEMNRSANRGTCGQICRRGYEVTDLETGDKLAIENKYIMSPKDLCTIGFVDKMIEAGVRVFKIEGRARGPEYVATVVKAYNEALNMVCEQRFTEQAGKQLEEDLKKVFNRGFWNGYYLGQRLGEWSEKYGSSATRVKRYAAKGVKYFSRLGVAEFKMETGTLHQGDEIIITGPTTGAIIMRVGELRVGELPAAMATKGDSISIKVPRKVRPSDKLFVWDSTGRD